MDLILLSYVTSPAFKSEQKLEAAWVGGFTVNISPISQEISVSQKISGYRCLPFALDTWYIKSTRLMAEKFGQRIDGIISQGYIAAGLAMGK